jgi:hypothetical protein
MNKLLSPPLILLLIILLSGLAVAVITREYLNNSPVGKTPLAKEVASPSLGEAPTTQPSPSLAPTLPPLPSSKVLTGSTHVFQTFNNCGPASLSMALSFYDQTVSQQQLGNQLRPYQNPQGDNDDKSVTLAELAAKAADLGYLTFHRPAGDIELLQQFVAHDMPVITLTWLKPNEDIGHYRIIKGYDLANQTLIQDDSLQGKDLSYSYNEFNQLWQAFNYEFLVLVPPEKEALAAQILGERVDETTAWRIAANRAQEQLVQNPEDIYAQFNLAKAQYYLGEYPQAVSSYEQVAARLPRRMLWYQIEPILAYYQLGQHDQVLAITQQIFDSQNRGFSELHWLRGLIYQQRGQTMAATEAFRLAEQYNTTEYWKTNLKPIL